MILCLVVMRIRSLNIHKIKSSFITFTVLYFLTFNVYNCKNFQTQNNESDFLTNILFVSFLNDIAYANNLQSIAKTQIGSLPVSSPGSENDTIAIVELGNKIFRDINLSENRIQACITCHPLNGRSAGMDRQSTSRGTFGQLGKRNTPTILNIGFSNVIFWDGRRNQLYDQAIDPFINPLEMSLPSETELIQRIQNDPTYQEYFINAFPEDPNPTLHHVRTSISAFERSLISNSRYDDFINGNLIAMTRQELDGLKLFMEIGCTNCHSGFTLGGNGFGRLENPSLYNPNDLGKFEVTGDPNDRYVFKVPSLRNVSLTQPYFHDGSVSTLNEAIERMNAYGLNRNIQKQEIDTLILFLKTLSDKTKTN